MHLQMISSESFVAGALPTARCGAYETPVHPSVDWGGLSIPLPFNAFGVLPFAGGPLDQ